MQRIAAILLVVSIVLLVWNAFGMERTIELTDLSEPRYGKRDDGSEKGASHAELSRSGKNLILYCAIRAGYEWPYCGYFFSLGEGPKGADLSGYDTVAVDVQHIGPPPHAMRLYIRNFEPGISNMKDWDTQKVNEIEFDLPENGPVVIPLKLLRTATWWNAAQHVPLLQRDMRIDHVTDVELYTGGGTALGQHRLILKSIRFQGKLISQHALLLWLTGTWIAFGIVWLTLGLIHYRAGLHVTRLRLAKLSSINRALELDASDAAGQGHIDALTGALNRQGLRNLLMKQLATDEGGATAYAVMSVDIDHFRRINEEHGPSVGDMILRHFASMIKLEIRATDHLVRLGSDAFLIICLRTDLRSARTLGDNLRSSMAREPWPARLAVTASFGLTETHTGEDFGEAINRAEKALDRAKQNGRNRIELQEPAAPIGAPA